MFKCWFYTLHPIDYDLITQTHTGGERGKERTSDFSPHLLSLLFNCLIFVMILSPLNTVPQHLSPPPLHPLGPSLFYPHKAPLHYHHPLQLLTVPQRESAALMDAPDGPFPWSSRPQHSVCSAGSEARPPHEMHVVTRNKRRALVPTKSHSTLFSFLSSPKNRGELWS